MRVSADRQLIRGTSLVKISSVTNYTPGLLIITAQMRERIPLLYSVCVNCT